MENKGKRKSELPILQELVALFAQAPISKTKEWDYILKPGSDLSRLYTLIRDHAFETDEEGTAMLFPGKEGKSRFNSLKNKLKNRLLDVVHLLDIGEPRLEDRNTVYALCAKRWMAAMVLFAKGARTAAFSELEKTLALSLQYEFTSVSISILQVLIAYYGAVKIERPTLNKHLAELKKQQEIWMIECKADELLAIVSEQISQSRARKKNVFVILQHAVQELEVYSSTCSSFRYLFVLGLLKTYDADYRKDVVAMVHICEQVIAALESKPYNVDNLIPVYYYYIAEAKLWLREYQQSKTYIDIAKTKHKLGIPNWFRVMELDFLVAMHTCQFAEAHAIYMEAKRYYEKSSIENSMLEIWHVYEAYLYLLQKVGKVSFNPGKSFKLGQFLNSTPFYSKDKQGINISILIIQILFLLVDKKEDELVARFAAMEKYYFRHLRKDGAHRSNCMIKLLLEIPKYHFNWERIKKHTSQSLKKLELTNQNLGDQPSGIEILPYEYIWELIGEILAEK